MKLGAPDYNRWMRYCIFKSEQFPLMYLTHKKVRKICIFVIIQFEDINSPNVTSISIVINILLIGHYKKIIVSHIQL